MRNGYTIKIISGNKEYIIDAAIGMTLLDAMRVNGLSVSADCGGSGLCGKCRVKITKSVPIPTVQEQIALTPRDIEAGFRLACLVKAESDMTVEIPAESQASIVTEGIKSSDKPEEIQPLVQKNGHKLLTVEKGGSSAGNYGIAADIGTTTVVCYLVNLQSGAIIDTEAHMNKQRAYGADVISRIDYTAKSQDGLERLRTIIVGQLNEMILSLCGRNGIDKKSLHTAAIVGNTTMLHLLLGLPVTGIAVSPFLPVTIEAMDIDARDTGLDINGIISLLPGSSAYVGADITAGIIACNMAERIDSEKYSLLLDLGTNGEIALCGGGHILSCAVAAGPAFEGGNISCGMSGTAGAVSAVCLDSDPIYATIGGQKAAGICGSGVLDTVSELLRLGFIDETGLLSLPDGVSKALIPRLTGEKGQAAFTIEQSGADGRPIELNQKDIRQVQLAKAAFSAGIEILLKAARVENAAEAVEKVYIAGGFGSYMNIESALRIGLIPPELSGKIVSAGNAAGAGAVRYLISRSARAQADNISACMRYIELSGMPEFQDAYIEAMIFPER